MKNENTIQYLDVSENTTSAQSSGIFPSTQIFSSKNLVWAPPHDLDYYQNIAPAFKSLNATHFIRHTKIPLRGFYLCTVVKDVKTEVVKSKILVWVPDLIGIITDSSYFSPVEPSGLSVPKNFP